MAITAEIILLWTFVAEPVLVKRFLREVTFSRVRESGVARRVSVNLSSFSEEICWAICQLCFTLPQPAQRGELPPRQVCLPPRQVCLPQYPGGRIWVGMAPFRPSWAEDTSRTLINLFRALLAFVVTKWKCQNEYVVSVSAE